MSALALAKVERLPLARPTVKSADTRARIVQGALRALQTHGLGETTTRRIAEEADVRLATLHYHFTSKEELLLAVFETVLSDFTTALEADVPGGDTLDARVAEVALGSWAHSLATRETQIVQYELTIYALRTKGSEWLARQQYQAYVDTYAMLLRGGSSGANETMSLEHYRDLARLLLAGIDGLILQLLTGAPDDSLRMALAGVIAGVQARGRQCLGQAKDQTEPADA